MRPEQPRTIDIVSKSGQRLAVPDISEDLYAELEALAAQQGIPLSDFIRDVLRGVVEIPPVRRVH